MPDFHPIQSVPRSRLKKGLGRSLQVMRRNLTQATIQRITPLITISLKRVTKATALPQQRVMRFLVQMINQMAASQRRWQRFINSTGLPMSFWARRLLGLRTFISRAVIKPDRLGRYPLSTCLRSITILIPMRAEWISAVKLML